MNKDIPILHILAYPAFLLLISVLLFIKIHKPYHKRVVETYVILRIDPPKHMYVDIKNFETGEVYKDLYVSKWCGNASNLSIGQHVYITRAYYMQDGVEKSELIDLDYSFCN